MKEGARAKPIHDTTRADGHRGEDMHIVQSTNTLMHHGHRHDGTANSNSYNKGCEGKGRDDAQKDVPVAQPTSTHFSVAPMSNNNNTNTNTNTTTMSQDLSSLSISSLQETDSIISDRSLIMEDAFEIYESYSIASSNTNSIIESLRLGLRPHSEQDLYSLSNTSSAALSPSKAPLSALERIQLEQKLRSQEQERLAEIILPSGKSKGALSTPSALPTREIPRELMPAQPYQVAPLSLPLPTQQFQQEPGSMVTAIHDAAMYDQLLTLASGPNRPRLPSQIEWQRGFEELRQKRKDQAAATNSVGRQNSTGSRHSQESSDGKSRRHSMPDMPHGQSEDRNRRGDAFRNPMLVNQSGGACVSAGGKRRSGYEDREQQLQQPPIQQQSILESHVMDTSAIPRLVSTPDVGSPMAKKKGVSNKRPEICVPDQYIPRDDAGRRVVSPVDNTSDKDAVDMAFDEMLVGISDVRTDAGF